MARDRGRDDFGGFPPSVPRKAKGGIRAQSKRGAFASSWWGRRWIEVLEGFGLGARLGRGRRYARQGQVLTLEVDTGEVVATVQGSRARPYRVVMRLSPIPAARWAEVVERLAADVRIGAHLLAGEMPLEVEEMAREAGVRIFPGRVRDLATSCSCPDWSNPCKHIAAVHYLLAEELDRDPFLLFRLRGMDRESFAATLSRAGGMVGEGSAEEPDRAPEDGRDVEGQGVGVAENERPSLEGELWPTDPATFWGSPANVDAEAAAVEGALGTSAGSLPPEPSTHAALARRLGAFPFWRGEAPFLDELADTYRKASELARALLEGEEE